MTPICCFLAVGVAQVLCFDSFDSITNMTYLVDYCLWCGFGLLDMMAITRHVLGLGWPLLLIYPMPLT